MSNKRNSKSIKFLSPFGILITIEATLIRLKRILWRYEAKTYTNISYENLQSQIIHFHEQKSISYRKMETVRVTGFKGPQYSNRSENLQVDIQRIYLQHSCFVQKLVRPRTWRNLQSKLNLETR